MATSILDRVRAMRRHLIMSWLRLRLRKVDPTAYICPGVRVKRDLHMGAHSFINVGCVIDSHVQIGRYSMLGPYVCIVGADHNFDRPGTPIVFAGRPEHPETIIEDDVWIGAGAIILAGRRIGRGSIVAAGTVVTKDVPPCEIHMGLPNRKMRDRFESDAEKNQHLEMLDGPLVAGEYCRPKS